LCARRIWVYTKMISMKIVRIVLLLLGLGSCMLAGKALMGVDDIGTALEEAVVLESPVVLEENEGKLVVLYGVPEMTAPAYDEEMGLTLDTIKALRYKESYERTGTEEGKTTWEWTSKGMETLFGEAKLGEFSLDETVLKGLPTESDYTQFDQQEAQMYNLDRPTLSQPTIYVLKKGDYYYDEKTLSRSDNGMISASSYAVTADREGTVAYHYRHFNAERYDALTIVGRQTGSTLTESGVGGLMSVHTGVMTLDKLADTNQFYLTLGSGMGMLFGVLLMLPAIKNVIPQKENQKRKKGKV